MHSVSDALQKKYEVTKYLEIKFYETIANNFYYCTLKIGAKP